MSWSVVAKTHHKIHILWFWSDLINGKNEKNTGDEIPQIKTFGIVIIYIENVCKAVEGGNFTSIIKSMKCEEKLVSCFASLWLSYTGLDFGWLFWV